MNFYNQKLFIPYERLYLPPKSPNGKYNCFYFYGENVNFIETFNFLEFKRQYLRRVFVPTIARPRSYLTPEYMKVLRDRKLLPVRGLLGDYSKVQNVNFYFDATRYLDAVNLKYKVRRFNAGYGAKFYKNYINTTSGIDKNMFDTTILYAVNLEKPIPNKLFFKKGYILFDILMQYFRGKIERPPFEKIILFAFTKDTQRYIKLFDINAKNNNIVRFKQILLRLQQQTDGVTEEDNQIYHLSKLASNETDVVDNDKKDLISNAIKNYSKSDSEVTRQDDFDDTNKLVTRSVVYNVVGDIQTAEKISKKIERSSPEKRKEILNKYSEQLLPREPAKNASKNTIVKMADVPRMIDYQSPSHIFNKRKIDFKQNLKTDISDAFKQLETKDVPLKLNNIEIKEIHTGASEIYKSIKDRYLIELKDNEGNIHPVHIDVPHLNENSFFEINGQQKILVNQILRFPIFFPSINVGRFESSYSTIKMHSKELRHGAYIILFAGSYKFPILMMLAYKYGLGSALKDYGVSYRIE